MSEADISLRFDEARKELDGIDKQATGAKKRIIKDLAKDLEKWLPVFNIADEIAHQLEGKISKSLVYATLDERYKSAERVRAQKEAKAKKELSPQVDLDEVKEVITVATDGQRQEIADMLSRVGFKVAPLETQGNKQKLPPQPKPGGNKDDFEAAVLAENFKLKQRIKELERPFDYPFVIRIGALKIYTSIHVRPANKEVARVDVDEDKLPKEMYA